MILLGELASSLQSIIGATEILTIEFFAGSIDRNAHIHGHLRVRCFCGISGMADGTTRYPAMVRVRKGSAAVSWAKRREVRLEQPGALTRVQQGAPTQRGGISGIGLGTA
jgi:hypothetical protein